MAFSALTTAPWGVVVQQDEAEAFSESETLRRNLLLFGGAAFAITLAVAGLLTRSVVNPIKTLTAASQRIAAGDLTGPIPAVGGAEVGTLARSFDIMREKLKDSLDEISGWNLELERRVEERTKKLEEAEQGRRELLRKLVVVQEEERRALARELHDETSQALTALVVGLETAMAAPADGIDEMKRRIDSIKPLATEMLREIKRIILDLRPAILDDLGLVQAIDWFAESRLDPQGVCVELETTGVEKRLPSEVETVVFRIAQEAINNVARHAKARNVSIGLDFRDSSIQLAVEDDGWGFLPEEVLARRGDSSSFGLTGMRERVTLFGGTSTYTHSPAKAVALSRRSQSTEQAIEKIRLLLVDDHAMLRDGLRAMLALSEDMQVIGEAGNGWEAIAATQRLAPDIVIMDMAMPGMDGLEATRRIMQASPQTKTLVLSQHDNDRYVLPVLRAGAMGYVFKQSVGAESVTAIRAVRQGEYYVPPSIAKILVQNYRASPEKLDQGEKTEDSLTEREKEILKLVAEGHTSQEIAEVLSLSRNTVMCHRANIYQKPGTHNRTELIRHAARLGLVELGTA